MNRKEISEIKKQLTVRNCSVTRLCGCYVDGDKNVQSKWDRSFLSLPEDEIIRYLDILRKVLCGGLGKDLANVRMAALDRSLEDLPLQAVYLDKDDNALNALYEQTAGNLEYRGPFAVLAAFGAYDVPGKTSDGIELEDGSEEVYEYNIICVCPVNLQKPGLAYDPEEGAFVPLETARMLGAPIAGILYPAFNDRSQDLQYALCYCRNMDSGCRKLAGALTGSRLPMPAKEERAAYMGTLDRVLGPHASLEEIRKTEENLQKLKQEHSEDPEPYGLTLADMTMILRDSGIDDARIGILPEAYGAEAGKNARLTLDNLGNLKDFTISMEGGELSLDPAHAYKARIRELEGQKVLVLPLKGNVEANGFRIDIGEAVRGGQE